MHGVSLHLPSWTYTAGSSYLFHWWTSRCRYCFNLPSSSNILRYEKIIINFGLMKDKNDKAVLPPIQKSDNKQKIDLFTRLCLRVFFILLQLELPTQFPAANEWKISIFVKNKRVLNQIHWSPGHLPQSNFIISLSFLLVWNLFETA